MPRASDTQSILYQNLLDAGCGPQMTERRMAMAGREEYAGLLCLLCLHKKELLDRLHQSEKQIDCLDYLIFQVEKRTKTDRRNPSWKKS